MDRNQMIKQIDDFFDKIMIDPEKMDVNELIYIIEAIIPVHAKMEISSYDEVDTLLAVYPYLYQKMIRLYAYFIHKVRVARQLKNMAQANVFMAYRDPIEELIKAVKLQYDALSRRITNEMERRG